MDCKRLLAAAGQPSEVCGCGSTLSATQPEYKPPRFAYPIWTDRTWTASSIRRAVEKSEDRAEPDPWKFAALAWEKLEPVITNILLWKEAMIEACVVNHQSWYDGDPKRTLNELIAYEVAIALDPAVSADARKLQASLEPEVARLKQEIEDLMLPLHSDRICPKCKEQFRVPVNAIDTKARETVIGRQFGEVVATMERTMRCSDCQMLVGEQHRPGCHRQGLVTETSDYRDRHNWKHGDPLVVCMRCGAVRTQANDAGVCR